MGPPRGCEPRRGERDDGRWQQNEGALHTRTQHVTLVSLERRSIHSGAHRRPLDHALDPWARLTLLFPSYTSLTRPGVLHHAHTSHRTELSPSTQVTHTTASA